MAKIQTPAETTIRIAGKEIKQEILNISLEQMIDGHHRLAIRLSLVGRESGTTELADLSDYTGMLGESISLTIVPHGDVVDRSLQLAFTGLVTEVKLENSIDNINSVLVCAMSPTVALDGGHRNEFFTDQSASDIIGSILQNYPMTTGQIENTGKSLAFCVQYRQSDYDFIMRLAAAGGLFACYDGMEFRAVKAASSDQVELKWRETLGAFTVGLGTASKEFESSLFNYEEATVFSRDSESVALQASLSTLSKLAPDASAKIYTRSGFSDSVQSAADMQSLDAALERDRNQALGRMIKCVGESDVPAVKVGHCVRITGMGALDGSYWIEKVLHYFDESGYTNRFVGAPLDMAHPQPRSRSGRLGGIQSAIVVDNADPDKLGRIKVKFPWSRDEQTVWVRMITPYAGTSRGWYSLPEIDDEVLIGFEHNNPGYPVALGAVYNGNNKPPDAAPNDDNNIKLLVTRSGHQVVFSDEDGKESILISTKDDKNKLIMDVSGPSIAIESEGDISIKGKNITIESQEKLNLKAGTDFEAGASANLKTDAGANCEISASGNVDVKGAMINLN